MIAAFLCGLFYGALLLDAVKREGANRRLDGLLADLREFWNKDEGCGCDECCGCGEEEPEIVGVDFCISTNTGCEDG